MDASANTGQQETKVNPDYFTLKELSEYSRIGVKKLKEAIEKRELPCAFPDSKAIVSRKDFEIWFNRQKTKSVPTVALAFEQEDKQKRATVFSFD